jgi:uncharacterized membrane protein
MKRLLLVLTVLAGTVTVQADDKPLLIELALRDGALPAGVSASGAVVVGQLTSGGGFYWMPTTGVIFIGSYQTLGVSGDGRTIVGIARDNRGIQQAAIWLRAAEWRLLGGFPNVAPCIDFLSGATGTSDDGGVVVGWAKTPSPINEVCDVADTHAFRWEASSGVLTDLGGSSSGRGTFANGVSGDGKVVVGYQEASTGQRQGARWVEGRRDAIPPPAGSSASFVGAARATNRDGSVIVGQQCFPTLADDQTAWVWTAGDGTRCLLPPRRYTGDGINNDAPVITRANATSADGRIVVGEQGIGQTDTEAVIWIDRTPYYLKEYLQANGIPNAFQLYHRTGSLTGISPDGRVIVGNGAPVGGYRGYIVILPKTP